MRKLERRKEGAQEEGAGRREGEARGMAVWEEVAFYEQRFHRWKLGRASRDL